MQVQLSKHFIKRWAERINGISVAEVGDYVKTHSDKIESDAMQVFDSSRLVWEGSVKGNALAHFYLKDNIIMLTNKGGEALITVYRIDYHLPYELNTKVRKGLVERLDELETERQEQKAKDEERVQLADSEIEILQVKIDGLTKELESAQAMKKFQEDTKRAYLKGDTLIGVEIKNVALKLVSSKDLFDDIAQGNV